MTLYNGTKVKHDVQKPCKLFTYIVLPNLFFNYML